MADIKNIKKYVNNIAKRFNPEQIILFGSYAYGAPKSDSDVDLLIIMEFNGRAAEQAFEIRKAIKRTFPLDIIVRRPLEVRRRVEAGDFFLKEATEKGKVLYERISA